MRHNIWVFGAEQIDRELGAIPLKSGRRSKKAHNMNCVLLSLMVPVD